MMRNKIIKALKAATGVKDIELEVPTQASHGDYSTNVALTNNLVAKDIVEKLSNDINLQKSIAKVETAGPGFINFWISEEALLDNLNEVLEKKGDYGRSDGLKGRKYLLEHTSPNTIKTLHVGHVRNNVIAMAMHNLWEFMGAEVTLDAINNDRGIHVMKAVWVYQKYGDSKTPDDENKKPDFFVDQFYIKGATEFEDSKEVEEEVRELLRKWEAGDELAQATWKKLRDWTFEGFEETYRRLGSHHDKQWFESDFYKQGKDAVEKGLGKKIFKKLKDGAVLSQLEKYGLTDTILMRSDGTSMYHTQDLELTRLKRERFPSDLYIWCVGPEQTLYLKQLFAMCEQLGLGELSDYCHISYGFIYLKDGKKMSSRKGNVVSADQLMADIIKKAAEHNDDADISEKVGMGALKYGLLKVGRGQDIHFDINESLSLNGNSGPYIQYTAARANSVLRKAEFSSSNLQFSKKQFKPEELALLRHMFKFSESVVLAGSTYSPNLICNYLYDLAQIYNSFYNSHKIGNNQFRLALTASTAQILQTGLNLLGIQAPERM